MKKVQCENKHFFDADAYSVCPHCGALPAAGIPAAPKGGDSKPKSGPKFKMPFFGGHKQTEDQEKIVFSAPVTDRNNVPHTENGIAAPNAPSFTPPPPAPAPAAPPFVQDQHTVSIHKASETPAPAPNYGGTPFQHPAPEAYQPTKGIFNSGRASAVPPPPAPPIQPAQPAPMPQAPAAAPQGYQEPPARPAPVVPEQTAYKEPVPYAAPVSAASGTDGKTIGVFNGGKSKNDPVAGWLVCLKGTNVGASYELFAKKNTIGRLFGNDVVLENEPRVSRESHAIINFDYKKSDFYLLPSNGDNPYINDEIVLSATKLSRFDKIEIGGCLLLFVPLCGNDFSWDEYINGEE